MMNKPEVFVVPLRVEKPDTLNVCGSGWGSVRFVQDTEVVRLTDHEASRAADKARINELLGLLREARELIEHGDFREGHCMCGGDVSRHTASDGHPPVDAGVYYAGQVMERIDAALSQPKVDA